LNTASSSQTKHLKQWFWKTSFSRRYSAQTDDKLDTDIEFFEQLIAENFEGASKYNYSINSDQLIKQKFTKSSPLVRAFLVLLAQNSPVDLVHGGLVDLRVALSEYNSKEYHHVFPRAYLKKREFATEKIDSVCNFCFLTADSNKRISSKQPSDYFVSVVAQENLVAILDSNLLPLNKDVYEKNDFEEFLRLRSRRVVEFLDKQLI